MTYRRMAVAAVLVLATLVVGPPPSASHAVASGGWPKPNLGAPRQHPKLAPALEDQADGLRPAAANVQPDSAGRIVVQVDGTNSSDLAAAVEHVGGTVRTVSNGSILAWVSPANLGALSDDARVASVDVARSPKPVAVSQGVAQTGANTWQSAGLNGTGVKVGVVDVGFQSLTTEQTAGRMPLTAVRQSFCGTPSIEVNTTHGTAVAEIVHQMAPNAALYLVCVQFDADIASAEQYFATQGVSVVNASITSLFAGRGDGTGVVGDAVAAGKRAGQLWSVAAGNYAERHFAFTAVDSDQDTAVEFTPSGAVPGPDSAELFTFTLPSSGVINLGIRYDAWPVTNQEFDVCVWTAGFATSLGCQGAGQEASPRQPITGFFQTGLASGSYLLAIFRGPHSTIAPRMDMFFEGNEGSLQRVSAAGSVSDPGSSPSAMTIGAYYFGNGALEPFSSQGPTIDGRRKPDIAGPDGVSNDLFNPFFGTSASTPHATGAAALVKQKLPSSTPGQIQTFLECRAVDAGSPGLDNQFGYGKLNLGPVPTAQDLLAMKPAVARGTTILERSGLCRGIADTTLSYGDPGDVILLCDWDGNGTRTPGVFRNGRWFLRNVAGSGAADVGMFVFGDPGDVPVCGHWSGPGTAETVGVFRRGLFFLRTSNTSGSGDLAFGYGTPSDTPVTGDWDGNGTTTVGVFRSGTWFLRNSNSTGVADQPPVGYGNPTDVPVAGDWDGNGTTTLGVFRNGVWFLRNSVDGGVADLPTFGLGDPRDIPRAWR